MAIKKDTLDDLLAGRDPKAVFSKDGLFDELKKALAERVLNAELDNHLDNEVAEGTRNGRNGSSKKTVLTETAKIDIRIPRDREGTFDPKLIQRYRRRFPGFDDRIVSMYTRGMTVREIQGHLLELYGLEVSPDLISTVTEAVLETLAEWRNRPLERAIRWFSPPHPLAATMGADHPVLRLCSGRAQNRLHHEYYRGLERQAAAGRAGERPFPQRRGGDQAHFPGLAPGRSAIKCRLRMAEAKTQFASMFGDRFVRT
jgi:Transposase, Mutator family